MTTCYNEEKKVMFIHVHKCAGTAISKAFFGPYLNRMHEWVVPREDEINKTIMDENNDFFGSVFSSPKHFRAIDAQKLLGDDVYRSYFSFAVSRNPWDRLASWYYFLRQNQEKEQSKFVRQLTMEDFIKYSIHHFYLPQFQWVTDETGRVIVDEIIKLENLDKRWPEIAAKVSDEPITLFTINASSNTMEPKANPFSNVRTQTLEKFREAYAKDFEIFNYSSDLPPHRADNPVYINCEKVWNRELNSERNIKSLCETYEVPEDFYTLYRESNSSNFYNSFLENNLQSHTVQRSHIIESLRDSASENDKLADRAKKWSALAKDYQKTASEIAAALHKSERSLQNRTLENEKLAADVEAMKAEVKDLKNISAESNSNLQYKISENEKLSEKAKQWSAEAKTSQKTASEKAAALHKSERSLQNRITENENLTKSVEILKAEVKELKKAAAADNYNLRKSEEALSKDKKNTLMLKAQEAYVHELKAKNEDLKAAVDEMQLNLKTDFLALQNKIKFLSDKNNALSLAYQKAQNRNVTKN